MTGQRTPSAMRPIGGATGTTFDKLNAMRLQARQHRIDTLAERGWPETTQCLDCGDTGTVWRPDATGPLCECATGQAIRTTQRREKYWRDNVPARLVEYRLDTSPQTKAAGKLADWVASEPWHRGENLVIYGAIGTGKTGLAVGAMRAAHDRGASIGMIVVSDWLIEQRASGDAGDGDPMDLASQPSLLVIDDLGTQKSTPWVLERLYVLINRRYLDMQATIVTTNHADLDQLRDGLGARATSRLLENHRLIGIDGPDLRTGVRS